MTRILIADDHAVVRSGVRRIIEDQPGWSVVAEAADGKDAIAQAIAAKPDVAILDCALPLIDGIEATRQIRRRVPNVEVLIFTMDDNEILLREMLEAGARGYVLKSDAQQHLISAIRRWRTTNPSSPGRASEVCSKTSWPRAAERPASDQPGAKYRSVDRRGSQQQAERRRPRSQRQDGRDAPSLDHAQARPHVHGGIGALCRPQQFDRGLRHGPSSPNGALSMTQWKRLRLCSSRGSDRSCTDARGSGTRRVTGRATKRQRCRIGGSAVEGRGASVRRQPLPRPGPGCGRQRAPRRIPHASHLAGESLQPQRCQPEGSPGHRPVHAAHRLRAEG